MKNNYYLILILLILVTIFYIIINSSKNIIRLNYQSDIHRNFHNLSFIDENVWFIFTKINERSEGANKFKHMLFTMLSYASVSFNLHLIVDEKSAIVSKQIISDVCNVTGRELRVKYYDIDGVRLKIQDIVDVMKPHFSSKAGSYYSDSLFYISLGLHRIASNEMHKAILLDIDLQFEDDIALLFKEFNSFSDSHMFGLSPELAPVYYHLLSTFRTRNYHRKLNIGLPCCAKLPSMLDDKSFTNLKPADNSVNEIIENERLKPEYGRPGLNSGVVLLKLNKIRNSKLFQTVTTEEFVTSLTEKYMFKGHLGDQDFYSLLSWELPSIIYTLDCGWNRQLCTWWKQHGYPIIHEIFSYCPNKTRIYHANCNSRFPV